MYFLDECPGSYSFVDIGRKKVKDCMNCNFPHHPENYDTIMKILSKQ